MQAVNHETRKHALLSASGASRWLSCTPSARLEEKFTESKSSSYAEEGTLAHEFADLNLRWIFAKTATNDKIRNAELKKLRANKLYTDDMESEVDKYITYVVETFNAARAKTKDAKLLIEQRLDFSHLVEQGFGTGDACIVADGVLDIIDLKYGKGVVVHAEDNSQLKLYGSGALREFEMVYDIHTVRLTIVQPRLDHVSTWEISAADLEAWGETIVKPKALEAYAGRGVQVAGDHCKWCRVKPMCKTLAAKNMELAKHDFEDPHLLNEKDLIGIFEQQPMLVDWVSAVADYLLSEAVKGKSWEGYKLVEGRSNRKWSDEGKVFDVLLAKGYGNHQISTTKMKGLGDIEKVLGKSQFEPLLGNFIIKPPGAPTLVPNADKRPALGGLEQARADFSDSDLDELS